MKTKSLGFIGGGRIARIFLQAFANRKIEFDSVVVFDTNADILAGLKSDFSFITVGTLQQAAIQPTVLIALHPPVIMETLDLIADAIESNALVVSLAPKITIDKISSKLKTENVFRMIPNATSFINQGYNPFSTSANFNAEEKTELINLLCALGETIEVDESKLEAYAILSAMLPTYFWFQWQELVALGQTMGLSDSESNQSVQQTLQAALNLYFDSGLTPEQVMDLIPVKPIADHQAQIIEIYQNKLSGLFNKIKP